MNVQAVRKVFENAIREADAVLAALPANLDGKDEVTMIEAVYERVNVLAEWIAGLAVKTDEATALKRCAMAWLDDGEKSLSHVGA